MRKLIIPLFLFVASLGAATENYQGYLELLQKYPETLGPMGSAARGEIEIISDPQRMQEIEKKTKRKVGIVAQDNYWIWLNDAVRFPSGKDGVYGRLLWMRSLEGTAGVAVMPILPDGKIALNRTFRHATRSWEYELPRGMIELNESLEQAALREVKEETGMVIDQLHFLGKMAVDTGLTNTAVPIFMAKVVRKEESSPEESEAIAAIEAFSIDAIKEGYRNGYLSWTDASGNTTQILLRDPFLTFALFQAQVRDLLEEQAQQQR